MSFKTRHGFLKNEQIDQNENIEFEAFYQIELPNSGTKLMLSLGTGYKDHHKQIKIKSTNLSTQTVVNFFMNLDAK